MPGDKKNGKNKNGKIVRLRKQIKEERQTAAKHNNGRIGFHPRERNFYILFSLFVVFAAAVLFTPIDRLVSETFLEGEISRRNMYALEDLLIVDTITTELNRQKAFDSVYDVYEMDSTLLQSIMERTEAAFGFMEQAYLENKPDAYKFLQRELLEYEETSGELAQKRTEYVKNLRVYESSPEFADSERRFAQALGINLEADTLKTLKWHHYRRKIVGWLGTVIKEIMERGVIADKGSLPLTSQNGIAVAVLGGDGAETERRRVEFSDIFSPRKAVEYADARIRGFVPSKHPSLRRELTKIIRQLVIPNLAFDAEKTLEAKTNARKTVSPVYLQVKKGELIVRKGEKITPGQMIKIRKAKAQLNRESRMQAFGGKFLALLLAIAAAWIYMSTYLRAFIKARSNVVLLGLLFLIQAAVLRGFGAGASVFAAYNPDLMLGTYLHAAPFALAPLIAAIFFSREIVVLTALLAALEAGLAFGHGHELHYVLPAVAGGMVAVFHVGRIKKRTDVWLAGLRLMAVTLAVIAMVSMLKNELFTSDAVYSLAFGALGTLVVVALTLTLLPLVERFFPVVSDIKLLELSDLNHPLLARMALVAPGTYHHSVVVGNLAEDAAEAIGANPLLARVGAYFHDIGKIDKPEYFIENQRDGENKHDNLNPSMSALIIASHVTIGLEFAREFKLIPQIREIIAEHHGKQLIQYFYQRAKDQENTKISTVNEQDYRYNGTRPRTRESAVVALADSVEAASRSLKNPTSSRIKQLVSNIIEQRFVSDELDDSHLTIHDLRKIGDSFVRILHGIFHYRVEYPDDRNNKENIDNGKAGDKVSKHRKNKKKAGPDIERTG
ncbi:MAG: HDIG domain-containing metalloprotein [Nitrospinota bacterium]